MTETVIPGGAVRRGYNDFVFVNCPFDANYQAIFRAIVFAIYDAGFVARCALEISDAAATRLTEIIRIISECRFGVHDISRTGLDAKNRLPRFNMPLELGIFLGCRSFGGGIHKSKSCLILDREPYRYQKFISDLAGQNIYSHGNDPKTAIRQVRNWLRGASQRTNIPGGEEMWNRFRRFQVRLPAMCADLRLTARELTFTDYTDVVSLWLRKYAA